jgi:hypothetical protein
MALRIILHYAQTASSVVMLSVIMLNAIMLNAMATSSETQNLN